MDQEFEEVVRRRILVAGLAAAASLGLAAPALGARTMTAEEEANVKVVADFLGSLPDLERLKEFLAADCAVRFDENQAPLKGPAAVHVALAKGLATGKVSVEVLGTSARGPVVMHERIDTIAMPNKPVQVLNVVGVFLIRSGKIKEWTDYKND